LKFPKAFTPPNPIPPIEFVQAMAIADLLRQVDDLKSKIKRLELKGA
jgi:hypothetical protein